MGCGGLRDPGSRGGRDPGGWQVSGVRLVGEG